MQNELIHYGIKGMKWGIRRTPEELGHLSERKFKTTREKKPNYNLSPKKVKRQMSGMTDAELQRAINRLNMQQQVNRMNPNVVARGQSQLKAYTALLGTIVGAVAITEKFSKTFG